MFLPLLWIRMTTKYRRNFSVPAHISHGSIIDPKQSASKNDSNQVLQNCGAESKSKPSLIVLNESDLVEKFVKGHGPGGQKINKCRHRVQLKHIPTGIMVESQRFRELVSNRKEARKLLTLKLDVLVNGDQSKVARKEAKVKRKNARQKYRANKKYSKDVHKGTLDDV